MNNDNERWRILVYHSEDEQEKFHENEEIVEYESDGEGKILVTMRILGYPLQEEEVSNQRENISIRYKVEGKYCNVIIDGRSYVNVASSTLEEVLTFLHLGILTHTSFNGSMIVVRLR